MITPEKACPNYKESKCCGNCEFFTLARNTGGFISDDCDHPKHPVRYINGNYCCDDWSYNRTLDPRCMRCSAYPKKCAGSFGGRNADGSIMKHLPALPCFTFPQTKKVKSREYRRQGQ